jgi:hypothetical protein
MPIKTETWVVTVVTEEWRDPNYPSPKHWGNKHWMTCTHRDGDMRLIREAEQVSIFDDPAHNHVHISVRVEDWFQCRIIESGQWHSMTELEVISYVSNEIKDLKSIMPPSP